LHVIYLTENWTVSIKSIGDDFRKGEGQGAHFTASAPGAENPRYSTASVRCIILPNWS